MEPQIKRRAWDLGEVQLSHHIIDYPRTDSWSAHNDLDVVRLHFGLRGDYDFHYHQLDRFYELRGSHNNILYSDGIEMEITNHSMQIETFGINFSKDAFIEIAQEGNPILQKLADQILAGRPAILAPNWRNNNLAIQSIIQEILHCPYSDQLRSIFLYAKSLELLVLQASLFDDSSPGYHPSKVDQEKLIAARDFLNQNLSQSPTIKVLAQQVQLNEYKLKKGFKALFGSTVFGYLHQQRMAKAKQLLLGTDLLAKEIAYEIGYSSPQHFNTAFKKAFGHTPKSVRKNPD